MRNLQPLADSYRRRYPDAFAFVEFLAQHVTRAQRDPDGSYTSYQRVGRALDLPDNDPGERHAHTGGDNYALRYAYRDDPFGRDVVSEHAYQHDYGLTISGGERVHFIGPFALRDGQPLRDAHFQRQYAPSAFVIIDEPIADPGFPQRITEALRRVGFAQPLDFWEPWRDYGPGSVGTHRWW